MSSLFSQRLKTLRKNMGLNQFEFAEFLGIKQPSLSKYERNATSPTLDVVILISKKCNVSLDWLCNTSTGISQFSSLNSIADVIRVLSLINQIDGLNFEVNTAKKEILDMDEYSCSINFVGRLNRYKTLEFRSDLKDDDFSSGAHLSKFLHDWKKIQEELSHLSDTELKKNYYKMWLEKQLEIYKEIPFIFSAENDKEFIEEVIKDLKNAQIWEED